MRKIAIMFGAVLCSLIPVPCFGQVAISASNISNAIRQPIASAKLCFAPVDATATPNGFRVGSMQVIPGEACATVTNGVAQTGLSVAPSPAGMYYHVYLKTTYSNAILRDYGMTAITGSSWSLDSFDVTNVVQPSGAPQGSILNIVSGSTSTAINGLLKGNGVNLAPAVAGTDYDMGGAAATETANRVSAVSAEATTARAAEAAAQATANAALPANGATSTGTGAANVVSFPGAVGAGTSNLVLDSPAKNTVSNYNDWQYIGCSNSITSGFIGAGTTGWSGGTHHCLNIKANFQAPGIDLGTPAFGAGGWSVHAPIDVNQTSNSPGISSALVTYHYKAGIGDTSNYFYNWNYGGAIAGSDEGNHLLGLVGGESNTVYTGTVSTGGSGATTVKVGCTNDCAFPGDGRYLLDMASMTTSTATAKTAMSGTTPGKITVTETITPSPFWGTLAASVNTPIPVTGLVGVASTPMTFVVNSGPSNTGAPVVSTSIPVCFSGDFHEQSLITSVSGTGPWTITVPLRHQHGINSWMMQGGGCGKFYEFTANTQHPVSQDIRYPLDLIGSTDAHTYVWRAFSTGNATIGDGSVIFALAIPGTMSNTGGVVTFTALNTLHPELFAQSTLVISGTGTAFDGNCTGSVANSSGQLTCSQATSTGLGPVSGGNIGIGAQYGNTAGKVYTGAEVLDVLDYTTNPPSVSPGNVTTFTLEPNNAAWAASDAVENVHHYATLENITSASLQSFNPMKFSAPPININLVGAAIGGGNVSQPTAYKAHSIGNNNPWNMYQYHGGTLTPPGGIYLGGISTGALFNYGLGMEYAPDPAGSSMLYAGCPVSGCTDAAFYYNVFQLIGNSSTGNGGRAQAIFYPNTRQLAWYLGNMDFWNSPVQNMFITSTANGQPAYLFFRAYDGGGTAHNYTLAASISGTGGTINLPSVGGTLALNTNFGASGGSHAAGLVPDPGSSAGTARFLREDASFAVPATFGASGGSHAAGYVPDPGSSAGTTRYLREDATWQTVSSGGGLSNVPFALQFLGDGSEGAYTCTSGTCGIAPGEHWYSSFNVSGGATVNLSGSPSQFPMIIRATGTCTIAGTVSGDARNSGVGNWGGGGGGGGGGTAAGVAGGGSLGTLGGGAAGGATGGTGGAGSLIPNTSAEHAFISSGGFYMSVNNTANYIPPGGAGGGAGGSSGPAGGSGGGLVIFACGSINFTGTVSAAGANGAPSTANNIGASGAGGGGVVLMRSPAFTNSGTITVTGGTGGSCGAYTGCGAGGNGAAGWSSVITN